MMASLNEQFLSALRTTTRTLITPHNLVPATNKKSASAMAHPPSIYSRFYVLCYYSKSVPGERQWLPPMTTHSNLSRNKSLPILLPSFSAAEPVSTIHTNNPPRTRCLTRNLTSPISKCVHWVLPRRSAWHKSGTLISGSMIVTVVGW